ncbi:MAG: ABC transporter permease [Bacillota bacterium]
MNDLIEIGFWRLSAAYFFVIVLLLILRRFEIGKEKEVLLSTIRMTIQLVLVGYLLEYLFGHQNLLITLLLLVIMLGFAINNVFSRIKKRLKLEFKRVISFSLIIGTCLSLFFFLLVVVGIRPWYEVRYFIPIAGMIIGNSMTGITLGAERLLDGMHSRKDVIEGALMMGAKPYTAAKQVVIDAFTAAILPTINSMVGMGIVFLPGMMTGQILSGISPITAIEYQIAIMLGIVGSVTFSVFLLVFLGYRLFFNERCQLEIN